MAKLSLSVNGNTKDNDDLGSTQSNKYSLSKKVTNNNNVEVKDDEPHTSLSSRVEETNKNADFDKAHGIANWLIEKFGEGIFEELVKNPNLKLPYTDENIDVKTWVQRGIKTLFTQDNIRNIYQRVSESDSSTANSSRSSISESELENIVKERMSQKVEKYNAKFQEMRYKMEELEGEKAGLQSKLNKNIQSSVLISEIFRDRDNETQYQKRIAQTLTEAVEQTNDESLPEFLIKFSKGWSILQYTLENSSAVSDEKDKLELVYSALTKLLSCISGCYISERRMILELVAKHCNEYFSGFDFVSPEQTLNADPEIHNASGKGNAKIREGVTFCVVRRDTKKTVKYADIIN